MASLEKPNPQRVPQGIVGWTSFLEFMGAGGGGGGKGGFDPLRIEGIGQKRVAELVVYHQSGLRKK